MRSCCGACCGSLKSSAKATKDAVLYPFHKVHGIVQRQLEEHELKAPENIVFARAMMPGWLRPDELVFELQTGLAEHAEVEGGQLAQLGQFWSRRARALGQWRMRGNVLYLAWPGSHQ